MKLCIGLYMEHPTLAGVSYKFIVGDVQEPYQREDGSWWVNINGAALVGMAVRVDDIESAFAVMANEYDVNMESVEWTDRVLVLI
jgi:deoxyinosine 3'endonuclease (endonuclease V)